MSLLEFSKICYENEGNIILNNISLTVEPGDFISIVGPSGSGKSTFLKLCSHLISPTSGDILFKNDNYMNYNPTELRKQISYCFQTPYLFGTTVLDNLNYPFTIRNEKYKEERIQELFSLFKMSDDFINKLITHLSGGEKQRIALLRSLIFMPEILLLDEVTSALDTENTRIVEDVILSLNHQGTTILWITHNLEQSRKYANKLLTIEGGEIKSFELLK